MKPENKKKVTEAIMDELDVPEALADKLADISMDAVQKGLAMAAGKLIAGFQDEDENP